MAKISNLSSLLLVALYIFSTFASAEPPRPSKAAPGAPGELLALRQRRSRASRAYVMAQCRTTRYPDLCVRCLADSTAQTPQHLAQIALRVSLSRARYARSYMIQVAKELKRSKAKEYQVVKDCLEQINDGVDQLTRSVFELQRIDEHGEGKFLWHQNNVQTWASAALTDALTCMDGFSGHAMNGKKKAIIKAKVLNVAQVTSNALALFNRFAARHKASHVKTP
ncbi:hypothetical protein LIER_04469 [Lithospermum erythrorhizon]|uniref:Pectinesterase inhibitor domain-containing protein n=1 Tax=Lithospermum erythrorhizon TaxID=34254 RepID=A0AAV3NYQ2_LITER